MWTLRHTPDAQSYKYSFADFICVRFPLVYYHLLLIASFIVGYGNEALLTSVEISRHLLLPDGSGRSRYFRLGSTRVPLRYVPSKRLFHFNMRRFNGVERQVQSSEHLSSMRCRWFMDDITSFTIHMSFFNIISKNGRL